MLSTTHPKTLVAETRTELVAAEANLKEVIGSAWDDPPMPSRLDDLSVKIGEITADVRELKRRASEDRNLANARHAENQEAMAELRQSTASAIAEFRQETTKALETLTKKLDRESVTTLSAPRLRLVALAAIGASTLVLLGWIIDAAVKAGVTWVLAHLR